MLATARRHLSDGRRHLGFTVAALAATAAITACGSSGPPEKGLLISGPGIVATQPPWRPQYEHLAQRLARLGIPTGDADKFHIHALLSIYSQGLYVSIPPDIGLDQRHHVLSSLHTHDGSGVIHMEAAHPFRYTLGDFFAVWGVRFGAGTLGALEDTGSNRVWVYVNGKPISDPARYVLKNGDDISIGYGTNGSFDHRPGTKVLKEVEAGTGGFSCSEGKGKKATSCLAPGRSPKGKGRGQ
jgi:hypothetical protein